MVAPKGRVAPQVWEFKPAAVQGGSPSGPRSHIENADGTLNVVVLFHEDVTVRRVRQILRSNVREFVPLSDNHWRVVARIEQVRRLAEADEVHWIAEGLPPLLPENDHIRQAANVDILQNFDTSNGQTQGLGGSGVRVGVFDSGFDESNHDFDGRVIRNDAPVSKHGTHVAGVIGSNGRMSSGNDSWGLANGGTAYQWRGMAPQAELIDAVNQQSFDAFRMKEYVKSLGMDVSNHSYSWSLNGNYFPTNEAFHDKLIRGDAWADSAIIPARLQVYSAGNSGTRPAPPTAQQPKSQVGYFSLTKQVKNGLVVGTYDPQAARVDKESSLGPAHDGRIKPDVVAPGANVKSSGYCASAQDCSANLPPGSTDRKEYYLSWGGSSDAAAAVTGIQALMIQQYKITNGTGAMPLLPSTLRAIAIHTAHDIEGPVWYSNPDGDVQAFAGPDFVSGYGLVDAGAAVDVLANRRYVEDAISFDCDRRDWWIKVTIPRRLQVTLAWDDLAPDPNLPSHAPHLVNDLDLELVGPTGTIHYPWLLDQLVVDAAGVRITDSNQACGQGTPVVNREFVPTASPNFVALNDPANVTDPMPAGGLKPATRGKDHLNNVEQVVVENAGIGWWRVRTTGFAVSSPQRFSLVINGSPILRPWMLTVCPGVTCRRFLDERICQQLREVCQPFPMPAVRGAIPVTFQNRRERIVLPLNRICIFAGDCSRCVIEGRCAGMDIDLHQLPAAFTFEVYDSKGRRIFADLTERRRKRMRLDTDPGQDYVLVIGAGSDVVRGREYLVPVRQTQ